MTVSATQRTQLSDAFLMQRDNLTLQALGAVMVQVWAQLVMHLITHTPDGVLNVSFPGTLSALARTRLFCDENLIETYLKTYAETQLITWDTASGLIGLPTELQPSRRAVASRENGKKGGRPRKTPKSGVVADQRQGSIVLPISGGKDVARENLDKTPLAGARDKLSLASTSSSEDKLKLDAMFKRIGPKAFEAAGFDHAKDMPNWGVVRVWLSLALARDMTEAQGERLILGVVKDVADRQRSKGNPASHMGYFSKAVEAAIASGIIPEAPKTADERKAERAFEAALRDYQERLGYGETGLHRPQMSDFVAQVAA